MLVVALDAVDNGNWKQVHLTCLMLKTNCDLNCLSSLHRLWTRSLLCRAGWMWSRETWTDSFLSMKCSFPRMDMGSKHFEFCSFLLTSYSLFSLQCVSAANTASLHRRFLWFSAAKVISIYPSSGGLNLRYCVTDYLCVCVGSVVCSGCWKPTLSTNQKRVTARRRGLWLQCCWWTCQPRYRSITHFTLLSNKQAANASQKHFIHLDIGIVSYDTNTASEAEPAWLTTFWKLIIVKKLNELLSHLNRCDVGRRPSGVWCRSVSSTCPDTTAPCWWGPT